MTDIFQIHQPARILSGKYADMVGTVQGTKDNEAGEQESAQLFIDGVKDGEPVQVVRWFKVEQIGRNHE